MIPLESRSELRAKYSARIDPIGQLIGAKIVLVRHLVRNVVRGIWRILSAELAQLLIGKRKGY